MTLSQKKIGVVIPYFRAPDALNITMKHIAAQEAVQTDVFVRDNSEDNILFTKAVNEGLRQFAWGNDCDYILVLNQDAILQPYCLKHLVQLMDAMPHVGIAGPVAINKNGLVNWAGGADAFPWGNHLVFARDSLPSEPYSTYWVNGACMMLRCSMLREIGLLDENMRFICSDADIAFTARSRGWSAVVVPNAFVEHEPGGSMDDSRSWLNKIKYEDHLYFAQKWLSGDLYRALSVEGKTLTPELIQRTIAIAKQTIASYS